MQLRDAAFLGALTATFAAAVAPGVAQAEDWITTVGDRIDLELSGNWTRVFSNGDGTWTLFITGGGNYHYIPMDADFNLLGGRNRLTNADIRLVDHQIARCPNGDWFHVASAQTNVPDDTAYVYRYDSDFNEKCHTVLAAGHPTLRFNDAPILCTYWYGGTASGTTEGLDQTPFYLVTESCNIYDEVPHPTQPPATGGSLVWDERSWQIHQVRATGDDQYLLWLSFDNFMDPGDRLPSDQQFYLPAHYRTAWPQSMIVVGDYYVLAHLGMAPDINYGADNGDIWINVLNRDFESVQQVRLTEFGDNQGANRPWISWQGDTIVVVYDQDLVPRLVPLTIDRAQFGLTPGGDDGGSGTGGGTGDDTGGGTGGSGTGGGTGGDDGGEEPNRSPVSVAGPDRATEPDQAVLLDGTGSLDPEDDALTYRWTFLKVPAGSALGDANISGADAAEAYITPDVAGIYEVSLVVDDGTSTDRDTVLVVAIEGAGGCGGCATPGGGGVGAVGLLAGLGVLAGRRRRDRVSVR